MFILASMIASQVSAQLQSAPNWQPARFGVALGGDIDMPHGLGHQYLISTAKDVDFDNSKLPFTHGEMTRMNCDNGTFRLGLSISPLLTPGTEWQFSILDITDRIDMVRYEIGTEGEADFQWLEVSAENKETAVEAVFIKRDQATKALNFHAGLGTNIGFSHKGKVHVKGLLLDESAIDIPSGSQGFDLTYNQRQSINQRLFLQAGMSVKFLKRMEFGLEFRKGLGYRATLDGPTKFTILKRSLGFSLRCQLF